MPKKVVKKNKGGRPTRYRAEYAEQAKKLCLLGYTDIKLAEFFGVAESTLHKWKHDHKGFSESLKAGKEFADVEVVSALYERAKGYSHPDVHISNYQGDITETKITKHYAPDPTSMIFWLKNRHPEMWRDKQVNELEGKIEVETNITDYSTLSKEEAQQLFFDKINGDGK